jgi:hypothetical protein
MKCTVVRARPTPVNVWINVSTGTSKGEDLMHTDSIVTGFNVRINDGRWYIEIMLLP